MFVGLLEEWLRKGAEGELIISGHTGQVVKTDGDYRAYAGLAPDLFAGDAVALNVFRKALWKEKRFEPQAFQSRQNFFAKANVTAIVIEIPSPLIGRGLVHGWATASLYGHAHDVTLFSKPISDFTEKVTRLANSAANPSEYANQILARICPTVLPYELDTPAYFNVAGFNGRALTDDVMGVILTLATHTALGDGVAPDKQLLRPDFPYFGEPHT
jgi:hypothetical protein